MKQPTPPPPITTTRACVSTTISLTSLAVSPIHLAQAVGQHLHDVEREARRLLHEEEEASVIDHGDLAIRHRRHRGASRRVLDERHLAEDAARADLLQHRVSAGDPHRPRAHDIPAERRVAFPEQCLAGLEARNIRLVAKQGEKIGTAWHYPSRCWIFLPCFATRRIFRASRNPKSKRLNSN